VPLPWRPQVPQGLKPRCLFVLNGTTKVVPSQLERKSCAAWRPQVPKGLKPCCLSSLTARLKSCPPTGNIGPHVSQRTARHRLRPVPQGLLKSLCLLSLTARLKSCPPVGAKVVRRLEPTSTAGLKPRCLLVINGTTEVVPSHWS